MRFASSSKIESFVAFRNKTNCPSLHYYINDIDLICARDLKPFHPFPAKGKQWNFHNGDLHDCKKGKIILGAHLSLYYSRLFNTTLYDFNDLFIRAPFMVDEFSRIHSRPRHLIMLKLLDAGFHFFFFAIASFLLMPETAG